MLNSLQGRCCKMLMLNLPARFGLPSFSRTAAGELLAFDFGNFRDLRRDMTGMVGATLGPPKSAWTPNCTRHYSAAL